MYKLGDLRALPAAAFRLKRARAGLLQSYGADLQRLRELHGRFRPELATYASQRNGVIHPTHTHQDTMSDRFVRLDVLEGVAAFHSGDMSASRTSLLAAQANYAKLQVASMNLFFWGGMHKAIAPLLCALQVKDDALAVLLGMGFSHQEATRALRFTEGNAEQAATFALDARQQAQARRAQDEVLRSKRKRQVKFGQTVGGHYVSLEALQRLTSNEGLGYPEKLAVSALKKVRIIVCVVAPSIPNIV